MKREPDKEAPGIAARRFLPLLLMLGVGALLAAGVYGFGRENRREVSSLKKEIETLNAAQAVMHKDIVEMRDLLRRQPAAAPVPREIVLNVGGAPFKGSSNATLTLIEFTDYECGFCARHVKETIPQLERDYIATGKLKYVFRNFPLESIHKQAFRAHEAAICSGEQGRFWEMHNRLFANQTSLTPAHMAGHAQALGLNAEQFQACLDGGAHGEQVRKDIAEGQKAGVTATPVFFLGVTSSNSQTLKVTKTIRGAKPYAAFKEAIDALLATAPPS